MKLHQSLKIILSLMLAFVALPVMAATEDQPLVELRIPQDNLAPYRERRGTSGMYVGVDYESLVLKNFFSIEDGASYSDIFGSNGIPLIHISVDYKYNFSLGALTIGADLGMGSVSGSSSRKLDVMKYGIGAKYVMDALLPEPYVAPYVGINLWKIATKDKGITDTVSETTDIGYNYSIGALIQLDWIDYDAAKQATFNYGLQNTFLDIYVTQYAKTNSEADINTETDFLYGAGLKFEF